MPLLIPASLQRLVDLADEDPGAIAIMDHRAATTRGELVERAGGLARSLDGLAGSVVALATTDVHDQASAALGVLAAGCTVAPLDPMLSPSRRAEVAASVGARVLLISASVDPTIPEDGARSSLGDRVVVLDPGTKEPLILHPLDADAPAMLYSSSGSTGEPKILPRTYRQLESELDPGGTPPLMANDRVGTLLGATGGSVGRTLRILDAGASAVVLDARRLAPEELLVAYRERRVTVLDLIPTYLRRVMEAAEGPPSLPELRMVTSVGEHLLWSDVERIRTRLNAQARVVNRYGATDSTRIAFRVVAPDEPIGSGVVPVGRPRPMTDIHIHDEEGRPVPSGEAGEVVVDSPLHRDVPGRVALPDGRHRYRTGDLGRIRDDGDLELIGRVDRLVKIGGIRVEPARIESVLRRLPWVQDAFVIPEPGPEGLPRLVAHVVGDADASGSVPDPLAHLRDALHPAEVPHRLVVHERAFPTLASGKVDGIRLQGPEGGRSRTLLLSR